MAQELRDRHGTLLGKITIRSDGKYEGRDSHGSLKGTYDPKSNQTRDKNGALVGNGNMLSNLVLGS